MMKKATKKKVAKKKKEKVIPKILIGVPILAWTHEFALSFLNFWTSCMTHRVEGRQFHVGFKFMYRRPVHMAEEELADLAIQSGCTHLLFMDDDIYDVTVDDLLKLLDADKDVISGIMYTSGFPHSMCAFRRYDTAKTVAEQPALKGPARLYVVPPEEQKGVVPVDLVPFCFTLIKTKIFKKLKKPWFTCNTQAPTDSWFMDAVMDKGIKPYAHFDVWLNHRGITKNNQPLWIQMGVIKQREEKGTIIELTPEQMETHNAMMTIKLQEAETKLKDKAADGIDFYNKQPGETIAVPITKIPNGKTVKDSTPKGRK